MEFLRFIKDNITYILGVGLIIAGIVGFLHHVIHFSLLYDDGIFNPVDMIAMATSLILITSGSIIILYNLRHDYRFIRKYNKEE